ncbi:MAG: hypothetical protein HY885_02435 [Deltaproteobacteria bacterium]|nr:hypothetical protein [Deltaproteobacteria bacterium]
MKKWLLGRKKRYRQRVVGSKSFFTGICFATGLLLCLPAPEAAAWNGATGGDGLPGEADCRACHDDLVRFPLLEEANTNKHHLLTGTEIILPTAPPGAVIADTYECLFCHPLVWDADIPGYTVSLYRDCLICHPVETVSAPPRMGGSNRHHQLGYHCDVCHDSRR